MAKHPTIYLTDEELEWIDKQEGSRSGVIRDALEHYRDAKDTAETEGASA